ncbi:ankyrin repeat domain-containing protein [Cellulophaga sp. E16_2]|uniref:ankyrin repeat domain-containing protein n=1 Tax=Cellulophaga sp. E16_2 TaxID=2789297 RepID=UPI001A91350B|nr:ankyrin repeat domain-containing protein [Cellulophaga sp. E16_2]MBO0590459.1 ankyrin repeat domain-containing protein [Cellulophaga sp. E16_2]
MKNLVYTFGIIATMTLSSVANAHVNPNDKSAKVETTSIKNVAPLSIAVAQSDLNTVKKFIQFGADVEVKTKVNGMTPLMYAARYNNVDMIKLLLDNGADKDAVSKMGFTALKYAELSGATAALALLK